MFSNNYFFYPRIPYKDLLSLCHTRTHDIFIRKYSRSRTKRQQYNLQQRQRCRLHVFYGKIGKNKEEKK
ncbi:hypothetical protein CVS40_9740 [Lucilia cuprina]|nr:hypothetical protein CVS40_9740 [Lucilia cuprina]